MIITKGRWVTYGEVWFDEPAVRKLVDIVVFQQRSAPPEGRPYEVFQSLATDLRKPEDELWGAIAKGVRYEIRRADRDDGLTHRLTGSPGELELEEFATFHDEFAAAKDLAGVDRQWLGAAQKQGRLVLTSCCRGDRQLVWHCYLRTGDNVRLLKSVSHFRNEEGANRAMIARANRYLHWKDILAFKAANECNYDWGGIFSDDRDRDSKNINDFKLGFGGVRKEFFNWVEPVSLSGKVYVPLRRLLRRS